MKKNLLVSIVLALSFSNLPVAYSTEVNDLESQLWQIDSPSLPSLQNEEAYLPTNQYDSKLILSISKRVVEVYQGEDLIATFPVAVGKRGWETPKGSFEVMQMVKDPAWEHPWNGSIVPPGPNNPLGQRWIGFWTDGKNFIGFHGTPNESLIGQAVSHGCVRMKNADIKKLFQLVSIGTSVTVR